MDPRELKQLLKDTKESLKKNDHQAAAKACKTIIKKEPGHYQANLLLGTSFREQSKWQQALEAYKKAAAIDPAPVYAWQGIISVYDKQNIKAHPDLLDAYKRVATHFEKDDKQKYIENTLKLANILISQQDTKKALKVIGRLAKSAGINVEIAQLLVQLLNTTTSETRSKEEDDLYTLALEVLVTETPQPAEETYKKYFSQLFRNGHYEKLAESCIGIQDQWNYYHSPMEWICRLYLESKIEQSELNKCGGIEKITDKLFKLHPTSRYGYFARGKYLIEDACKYVDGFTWINNALESSFNLYAALVLVRGKLKFGDYEDALEEASKAILNCNVEKLANKSTFQIMFGMLYWEGLIVTNCMEQAELQRQKLEEMLKNNNDNGNETSGSANLFLDLCARTALKKKEWSELGDLISKMEDTTSVNGIQRWRLDYYTSIREASKSEESFGVFIKSCLETHNYNPDMMLESAIFLYDQKEYEASAEIFTQLIKTKEGSSHPHTWKYLGQLANLEGDLPKAAKFLRKSYEISVDSEVGALLSDTYDEIGDLEEKRKLLIDATSKVRKTKSKWVWTRLGLMQLQEDNLIEAVESLQSAIRVDLEDGFLWESLADAYFYRGSLQAALRCYRKATEHGMDPIYPKMRISAIFQFLEEEDKSITSLKELLEENPNNSTLHLELARLYCWVASEKVKENFDKGAISSVERGLYCVVKSILHSDSGKPMLLPWLIIGDFSTILRDLPETTELLVPALLSRNAEKLNAQDDMLTLESINLIQFKEIGTKALLQCLQIMTDPVNLEGGAPTMSAELLSYVYHQLALSFYIRCLTMSSEEDKRQYLLIALNYAKKAIAKSQHNSIYWNTIGLVAFHLQDMAFAQHCFVKSLQTDSNNVVAWANLGMLYLDQGEYLLAHRSFAKGQSVAPIYANSWIGQALCAEALQPAEAPDLFRHACLLRPHPFAITSYGNAICDLLLKSEEEYGSPEDHRYLSSHLLIRMDAVTHLYDLISRIECRASTAQLFNLKGFMAGCNGFYQTALESFNISLNYPSSESKSPLSEDERLKVHSNRVSSLVSMKLFAEAKEELMSFPTLDAAGLTNAAITLYKLMDVNTAVDMYQRILALPEGEKKKSDVKIALALLVNLTMGVDTAKSILFGKDMMKNPRALLTLGAIAVAQNDLHLLKAIIHELDSYKWTPKLAHDIAFLHVCYEILQKSFKSAVKVVLKFIHMYPSNPKLYALACQVILTYNLECFHVSIPRHLALCTLKIAKIIGTSREESLFASKHSGVVSLTYLVECSVHTAIMATLKAIRCYPEQRDNWAVLACAYWMEYSKTKTQRLLLNVINILDREIELGLCSERIKNWMSSFRLEIAKYSVA